MSISISTSPDKLITPKPVAPKDDDADYRPMLKGIINTRCNYDGGKVEGNLH
jgi:hypothetical protein